MNTLNIAQEMTERGFVIFPVLPNSKVAACRWQNDDLPEIEDGQNYGVNCGKSGLVVVDIDGQEGIDSFEKLLGERNWPKTLTVSTPSGGYHLYFKGSDIHNSVSTVAPKVDIRGDGGYVVGPGSVIDGVEYLIEEDTEVASLPGWLERKIVYPVEKPWASDLRGTPVNGQDDLLSRLVYGWRAKGLDKEDAYAEWTSKVEEIGTLDESKPWTRNDFERHWRGADRKVGRLEVVEAEQVREQVGLFQYKTFEELDNTPFTYTIDKLLPTKCNVLFSAKAKAGKTTTTLNLVRALTSTNDFLGEYKCMSVSGKVVYVNLELDEVMLRKYGSDAGLNFTSKHLMTLNLRGMAGQFKILNDMFVDAWSSELRDLDCEVLIVDPLSPIMAMNGFDSDDNDGARRVLENFGAVQTLAGIDHLVIVDHSGHVKAGRPRGASAKMDWPDVIWNQEKNTDNTRSFSADGRGVESVLSTIARDELTKELKVQLYEDQDRERTAILVIIQDHPGITKLEIIPLLENAGHKMSEPTLRRRLDSYVQAGLLRVESIPHSKATGYFLDESVT